MRAGAGLAREAERRLAAAAAMAEEAGALVSSRFRRLGRGEISWKGRRDLATVADRESEALLADRIRAAFPGDAILAEEGVAGPAGRPSGGGPWLWIVDPLDGTTNFCHGVPHFAVSVGLWHEGRPVAGVVRDPGRGETWRGGAGAGAWRGEEALAVSAEAEIGRALLCTGFAYGRNEPGADTNLERFGRALMACQGIRRTGCASLDLCWVAAGWLDGFWEVGLAPYDVGAGVPIVLAAGGVATDLDGGGDYLESGRFAASNGRLHRELLALVGGG